MTQRLLAAARSLADALDAENAALRNLDLPLAAGLLPRKRDAAVAFEALEADLSLLVPAQHHKATEAVSRVAAALRENKRLLERAIAVQREVIATIVRAICPVVASPRGYGARALALASRSAPIALIARA